MLELRPSCEHCGLALPPDSDQARICTFECTFCLACATFELLGICPNCTGELVVRPRRPVEKLERSPAATTETRRQHDIVGHQIAVGERLRSDTLPPQVWTAPFANRRPNNPNDDYGPTASEMGKLAAAQPGFLGVESVRDSTGAGITNSRWSSIAALINWRRIEAHQFAQQAGRDRFYEWYRLDVARVDRTSTHRRN